jgi:uncharacterized protein (DUF305 family)
MRPTLNQFGEHTMKKIIILAVAGLALASVAAYAQMQHRDDMPMMQGRGHMMQGPMGHGMMRHSQMGHGTTHGSGDHGSAARPKGDTGPASLAFHGINAKMHEGMNIAFTGNADVDFLTGMIPHHQGAVDMARTVLAFGKDPEVRKLAEQIIKTQEEEIAFMRDRLNKAGR